MSAPTNRARRRQELLDVWVEAKRRGDRVAQARAVAALLRFDSEEEEDET